MAGIVTKIRNPKIFQIWGIEVISVRGYELIFLQCFENIFDIILIIFVIYIGIILI